MRSSVIQMYPELTCDDNGVREYWREQIVLMYGSLETEQHTCLFRELLHSVWSDMVLRKLLYQMVAHTRDILHGKGERYLCYRMIYEWCLIDPVGGMKLLETCVRDYGCWKDVKYFCGVVCDLSRFGKEDELILMAAKFMNIQLRDDWYGDKVSLVCKWIPREKSAYGWLFDKMALQWCYMVNPHILRRAEGDGYVRAITKCKMQYRKVLSALNRYVDVAEVKKCARTWSEIKPVTITVDGIVRQANAYLNVNNSMGDAVAGLGDHKGCCTDHKGCSADHKGCCTDHKGCCTDHKGCCTDRHISSLHTKEFFKNGNYGNDTTFSNDKVHSFVPGDFVKRAIHLIELRKTETNLRVLQNILYQMELLNQLWNHFSKNVNAIDLSIVPVIDLSLSMNHMAMCHAIGLGCVVAAKSKVGYRVMVMDHTPTWIILDDMEFVDMVKTIVGASAMRTARNVQGVFDFFDAQTSTDIVGTGDVKFCFFSSGSCAKELSGRALFWNCCAHEETSHGGRIIGAGTNAYLLNRVFLYKKDNAFASIRAILEDPQYHKVGLLFDDVYSA